MFTVELAGKAEVIQRFDDLPGAVRELLKGKVAGLAIQLRQHVMDDKLLGQVLNLKSGDLRMSITAEAPIERGKGVFGRVFSAGNVKYARIHEYGGVIPAHEIVPNKAEALAFMIGGKQVFAKRVQIPDVTMPERSFMRSSLADMADEIKGGLTSAVKQGLRKP